MFRFVFLASFGALALRPVWADGYSSGAMSRGSAPASAIARSDFALAQRDAERAHVVASKPVLQASAPTALPVKSKTFAGTLKPPSSIEATPTISTRFLPLTRPLVPLEAPVPPAPRAPAPSLALSFPPGNPSAAIAAMTLKPDKPSRGKASRTLLAALPSPAAKDGLKPTMPSILSPLRTGPKVLSSRDMMMLRQADSSLAGAQISLNRAQSRLTRDQQQLGVFTSVISAAMMQNGEDGVGLNPFVRVAMRYRGTPYVWGGESARGFDCSGFIMRVMRDLGYRALPHSAAEQFNYGMPIARELLKPGDIVFFANTYKRGVSHVGIYLGQRRFIHAANSKVGTIVSSIDDPKWIAHYAGARRLLTTKA